MRLFILKREFSAILIAVIIAAANCSAPRHLPANEVKFIVLGNTSPASPFTGYPEKLDYVLKSINQENPVLVIHTGNIVRGGNEWMGITREDVCRQYRNFLDQRKSLRPILHILAGDGDRYNGTPDLFRHYTGEDLFYSFNYGSIHFILLHLLNSNDRLSPDQMRWLERDLEAHRYDTAVFIFSHYPLPASPQSGNRSRDGGDLHGLFLRYPVTAVISGSMKSLSEYEKDGIRYIAAGCFGYNYEDWHWGFYQYYVAHYDGAKLTFRGICVSFPGNSYRPKQL
ncbi:MAG: hypothetical protein A2176_15030 [Spirochaetes bacterium RBG_13_51_14]|nr:MAG: hypothetical protein A2176_15030 [Spirochaetes bacterium RBG_13_51_14]